MIRQFVVTLTRSARRVLTWLTQAIMLPLRLWILRGMLREFAFNMV